MERKVILFNAKDKILGRLATDIARVLSGRDRVDFTPNRDDGAVVVVINSDDIALTGAKEKDKIYYRHTGYAGGIKQRTLAEQREKDSTWIIKHAVKGMLPKNKLASRMMTRLYVYKDDSHTHANIDETRA